MKIFKFNLKTIGQILFVIIFLSTTPAKSLDKFNKAERVSDYFSGILLLNDNQYEQSFNFFKNSKDCSYRLSFNNKIPEK